MITFKAKDIVIALGDDLRGDGTLAAHGIKGHNSPFECQQFQQLGDRGDLIGFLLGGFLAQHQAVAAGPGTDPMQRAPPARAVLRAARALAVDRNDLAPSRTRYRLGPTVETFPKSLWCESQLQNCERRGIFSPKRRAKGEEGGYR